MPRIGGSAVSASLRGAVLLLATIAALWTAQAAAQNADQLLQQGLQALQAGRFGDAAKALDASYRLQQKPQTLYNLGLAYKGMGYPDKALQAFESYVQFADPKKEGETVRAVKGEIERIRNGYARFVPKLAPADAQIEIDGQRAQLLGGELWVPVGQRKITVKAADYESYEQTLTVGAGRFDLEVALRRPSLPPPERAAALIDEGVALQAASNFGEAIAKYEQAQQIYPTPRGVGQLGLAEVAAGELGRAEGHINEAIKQRRDPWVRENRRKLQAALRQLRKQLGTLTVVGEPLGAEILVNGESVGALPLPDVVRIAAGQLAVRAVKQGYADFEQLVDLPARGKRTVKVSMEVAPPPVVAAAPLPAPEPTPKPSTPPPAVTEPPPPAPIETDVPLQEPEAVAASDIESFTDPQADLKGAPDESVDTATGFEMALNFGYHRWIGGPTFENSRKALSPQLLLGARLVWPLSFGLAINGGFDTGAEGTKLVANINPGLYVRGHTQREKRALSFDFWGGAGLQPIAVQLAALEAEEIDITMIDPNNVDTGDIAASQIGVDTVRTIQSINVPIELGLTFFITESFGLDLALALTFWLPRQDCLHDDTDSLCVESSLKSQTSFFVGGGVAFLP